MKKFVLFLFIGLALFWRADFFSPRRIQVPLLEMKDFPAEWPTDVSSTFRYLGCGRQAYAFESEDGKYVLKFFNRDQLQIPWYASIPLAPIQRKKERIKEKIRIYPESYRLAFTHFREETGLIVVHMGPSDTHYPTVQLIDQLFMHYKIDLNGLPFVLQKKGVGSLFSALNAENLQSLLSQFLSIHEKRIALCIADHDRDIKHNYSFVGDQLIYIDPARFYYDARLQEPRRKQLEWGKALHPIRKWMLKNAPEQWPVLEKYVQSQYEANYGT